MKRLVLCQATALTMGGCVQTPAVDAPVAVAAAPATISFSDLLARPRQAADRRIAYGSDPLQYGELWLPKGPVDGKLRPVAVLIHGGCWQADLPGTELMDYMAADLQARGYAVWNLEYRRIGHPGGGYPGTFQDIARGVDYLRAFSREDNLDLDRVVIIGHSAGGHLATWAAARRNLPQTSPLWFELPLIPRGVVSLAGIHDLADFRANGPSRCGGPKTIDDLVDATRSGDLYADTSPSRLGPTPVSTLLVYGALDPIVPARLAPASERDAGPRAKTEVIAGAGHFELIDPMSAAWKTTIAPAVDRLAR
jgi:acetyl esterase/lipase